MLSEVAQNGALTISSLATGPSTGDAGADESLQKSSELCRKAMTTLLQSYVTEKPPSDWKRLFKDAVNVGFMVKYAAHHPSTPSSHRRLLRHHTLPLTASAAALPPGTCSARTSPSPRTSSRWS